MEQTSDTETPPKRRRFSRDNPFVDSSDTELSEDEVLPKKIACSKTKGTNPTDNAQHNILTNTNQLGNNENNNNSTPSKFNSTTTHPSSSNLSNEITFNSAFDDFNIDTAEQSKLVTDFRKVMARFNLGDSEIEGVQEIQKTLNDLRPLNDVVYLYVRFARQQPTSNFNTDSLCSLLCIAKQCNFKPYVFLTKVKSLEIRNHRCKYGVLFSFVTRNSKDVDGVHLEKKFLGLKYTLQLLQETVTKSETILGKANNKIGASTLAGAKGSSLYSKLWLGINHRWLAYHMVDHLFSLSKASTLTNEEIFALSIQLFTSCGRSRYDFLNPLVGLCLQFENHVEIDLNQDQLATLRVDPNLFHTFGNKCLRDKTLASRIQSIYQTFSDLKKILSKKIIRRQISYRTLSLDSKWLLLKAYAYHLWLEQSQNNAIKSSVLKMLSQGNPQQELKKAGNMASRPSGPLTTESRKSPPFSSMSLTQGTAQQPKWDVTRGLKTPPLSSVSQTQGTAQANSDVTRGLEVLLGTRKMFTPLSRNDCHPVNNNPDAGTNVATSNLPDMIAHPNCDWNKLRLLSTRELNEILASYLIIRRDDGVDIVSRLSAFEIYSADNLHKFPHCRMNGPSSFYPTTSIGDVVLNIGNKIDKFIDVSSKNFPIAREDSSMFREHGDLIPSIKEIAALCRAVIVHGKCDSKRCFSQCRAFIGNGGLDFPCGIPTTIVDGGLRKKLTQDPTFHIHQVLQTIGHLSEFLWRTMVDMQSCAKDAPMAPDQARKLAYSNHLCTLLSMADCVSFEHITLVVSMIYPTSSDLAEHVDAMNDSVPGYNRTGTLNMCFMIDSPTNNFKVGLQLQVIGTFRRVIRQYMERTSTLSPNVHDVAHVQDVSPANANTIANVDYQPFDSELRDMAYKFGQSLRNRESAHKIIFEGRKSRRSDGGQSYSNYYSKLKIIYTPYRFKVAIFCDKEYARGHNIQHMKVLGHMEPPQDILTQVNALEDYESGKILLQYLRRIYGGNAEKSDNMRSATYHQQVTAETQSEWTIFEGHIDKNFVHAAWFVPLTVATFFTFIAVPGCWNVSPNEDSELTYQAWVSTLAKEDRDKLGSFQENFEKQAKLFMKVNHIQVLIYLCTGGSFLSFPANLCYHATVATHALHPNPSGHMKDLLIVYPMESG